MSFEPYESYKDSGVKWLGKVPEHWGVVQSRRLFRQRNEGARPNDEQLTASQKLGIVTQADFMRVEGRAVVRVIHGLDILKHVEHNDFVISMRSFQGGIEWSGVRGSISSAYVMLTPSSAVEPSFFRYLFKSAPYIQALQATSNLVRDGQAMRFENFTQVDIPLPRRDEQLVIASFLERETAKIDTLIKEQQRLIELLKEKRQAVISHAVTKGLDPTVSLKVCDTSKAYDTPGLAQVASNWAVTKVKHAVRSIEQGWSPQCDALPPEGEEWGVLKVGAVNTGVLNPQESKRLPSNITPIPSLGIHRGDVLVSRANTRELVGAAGVAETDYPRLMICDKLYRLTPIPQRCDPWFLVTLLRTPEIRELIEQQATGASQSMQNISQDAILELPIFLPPLEEQLRIVSSVSKTQNRFNKLRKKSAESITLLQERRSALISAAVTGKIDVRNYIPKEILTPDELYQPA